MLFIPDISINGGGNFEKIGKIVLLILLVFVFIGMTINFIVMLLECNQTEDTTTELTATISEVEYLGDPTEQAGFFIHIEDDFYELLVIPFLMENASASAADLERGQKITFRVKNSDLSNIYSASENGKFSFFYFVKAIALSTETETLFTIEQYNRCMLQTVFPGLITAMVFVLLSLVGIIFCIRKLRRR